MQQNANASPIWKNMIEEPVGTGMSSTMIEEAVQTVVMLIKWLWLCASALSIADLELNLRQHEIQSFHYVLDFSDS